MKEKQAKLPGPDGPIAMECNPARVVIAVAGHVDPDCRRELRYLRDGKIYAFATSAGNGSKSWNTSGSAVSVPRA